MLLLSGNFVYCQTTIEGTVTDSLQQPIAFANVFLKPKNSEAIIAFTSTTEDGSYRLTLEKDGVFEISFSAISFQTQTVEVALKQNETQNLNIQLKEKTFQLNEVIVYTEKPITIKEDTIIYNTDAFKRGNEETLEDLLKSLPGINVTKDGTIKVKNREIEKVMIEGDDLFGKGYKLLTKNLDANTVDNVEIYEHYSDNHLLKGIENSNDIALNLTLNDKYKNQLSAMLRPGYGLASENRYNVKSNIIWLQEKSKSYAFFNLNNVGEKVMGEDIQAMISSSGDIDFKNQEAYSYLNLISRPPDLGEELTNFNNAELVSLNNISNLSPKITLKTIGFLNWDEQNFFKKSKETYFLPTGNFTNKKDYQLHRKKLTGFLKTELVYDISKTKILEYSGRYNSFRSDIQTNLIFNDRLYNEFLVENQFTTSQRLTYSNKIKENQAFILTVQYIFDKKPENYRNNRFLFQELFPEQDSVGNVFQHSEHKVHSAGFETEFYSRNKNENLFRIESGISYQKHHLNTNFRLLENSETTTLPGFQNDLEYRLFSIYAKPEYTLELGTISLAASMGLRQYFNALGTPLNTHKKSPFFVNPRLNVEWKINADHRITTFYSYGSENPELQTLNENFVLRDFNSFTKGTNNLEPLNTSMFFFNYMLGTPISTFYANTSFIYQKNKEYFSSNSTITQSYQLNKLIRLKNRSFLNVQTELNYYLSKLAINSRIKLGYSQQKYSNKLNGVLRDLELSTYNYGAEIRSAFSGKFNFHIGTEWFENVVKTNMKKRSNTTNKSFLNMIYEPVERLNFYLNTERFYFTGLTNNNAYYFMDFETKYTFLKNKLSFSIVGKNLFNTNTYRDLYISDTGIFTSTYKLLPRYFLLKTTIRF
ncbi:MAG TPA: TonB-dependent receptor [Flavobacteriaceae bacterium]|nr:TonB-dependent receptor [Flavobacteriaceae bacterium]